MGQSYKEILTIEEVGEIFNGWKYGNLDANEALKLIKKTISQEEKQND